VLKPTKVVIENYPEGQVEWLDAVNNPEDESAGTRKVPFSRELWIEAEDFMAEPAPKFFRLAPGREVRLRYAYFLKCTGFETDAEGNVVELRATYDPETAGGHAPDGRKVKTTLHWVAASHAVPVAARLYTHLFSDAHPDSHEGRDPLDFLDSSSNELVEGFAEPSLAELPDGAHVQFERLGYFCVDRAASTYHRTVTLKDEWAKIQKRT
jgi:glutaminyl-tRNA synthetase